MRKTGTETGAPEQMTTFSPCGNGASRERETAERAREQKIKLVMLQQDEVRHTSLVGRDDDDGAATLLHALANPVETGENGIGSRA